MNIGVGFGFYFLKSNPISQTIIFESVHVYFSSSPLFKKHHPQPQTTMNCYNNQHESLDTLNSFINVLNNCHKQSPNQFIVNILTQIYNLIQRDERLQMNHKFELLLVVQHLVKNCFNENVFSAMVFHLCKEIVDILTTKPTERFLKLINFTHFDSNNDEQSITFELGNEALENVMKQFKLKWKNEKVNGYTGITGNANINKRIIRMLPKYEDYWLKTLECHWNSFHQRHEKIRDQLFITRILTPIYNSIKHVQESLDSYTRNNTTPIAHKDLELLCKLRKSSEEIDCKRGKLIENHSPLPIIPTHELVSDKSFKDLEIYSSDLFYKRSEYRVTQMECYINFDRIWGNVGRWLPKKYQLIEKGVVKSNELYLSLPVYRNEFVIGNGIFGPVEIGLSKCFHAIAIKRLTTENNVTTERCTEIVKDLVSFSRINQKNLLKTFYQNICGHTLLYTHLCEYNLEYFLKNLNQRVTETLIKDLSIQMIKGLAALHQFNPTIVHGNLKPENIFITDNNILKLAEFGITKSYSNVQEIRNEAKIWWPREFHLDNLEELKFYKQSDIHVRIN